VSIEDNRRVVANFVELCQNQHDLAAADEIFHPDFVNHYAPEWRPRGASALAGRGFQAFYGMLLPPSRTPQWRSMSNSLNGTW
jgi:hypothetical protein